MTNTALKPPSIADELAQFERDGYVVVRGLADAELVRIMRGVTVDDLHERVCPVELEADLHYPGAPLNVDDAGGATIRRLKQAHARHPVFTQWLMQDDLQARLKRLLGEPYACPLAHHNCIMTKEPQFSSDTGWHQDIRYWSFERRDLVNVWLALGDETPENGCLRVIPGSHRMTFDREQFDGDLFFREDLPQNDETLAQAVLVEMEPGDALFFHCRTFHAASRNHTEQTKFSVVFTFRPLDCPPIIGSRSASQPELLFW